MEQDVIEQVTRSLRLPRRRCTAIGRELRAHLEDAQRDLQLAGWRPEDAARESAARLGEPIEIADAFSHVHRPSRRFQVGLAMALATGMLLGVYGIGGSLASATTDHHGQSHVHVAHKIAPHP